MELRRRRPRRSGRPARLVAAAAAFVAVAVVASGCGAGDPSGSQDDRPLVDDPAPDRRDGDISPVVEGSDPTGGQAQEPTPGSSTGGSTEPGEAVAVAVDPDAVQGRLLSVGTAHGCVILSDGAVECWGNNLFGAAEAPAGAFSSVAAGVVHTCGLRTDAMIVCWGNDYEGQASPPAGTFTAVAAGEAHSCGLRSDGAVECWGNNDEGQADPPEGSFVDVVAGAAHTCGLRADDAVECWGNNEKGQADAPSGTFSSVVAGWRLRAAHRRPRRVLGIQRARPDRRTLGHVQLGGRGLAAFVRS